MGTKILKRRRKPYYKTILLSAIAIIFLYCPLFFADEITSNDTAEITLTTTPWISIEFEEGNFDLEVNDESGQSTSNLSYTARGNISADISIEITQTPIGSPGQWEAVIDNSSFTKGQLLKGNATVSVSNVPYSQTSQTYTGGLVTIVISAEID